ncbi:hypothetical protein QN277_006126 [Acacia crassicarpa]|uniref:Uncharacterized protein n=1 Tax=Acacia crassicarpa TaxID=499986 RepID=A0AAE1JYE8_9FABA|nr:hypothetical protein QN277_006126 [Acacia crassicarpa]
MPINKLNGHESHDMSIDWKPESMRLQTNGDNHPNHSSIQREPPGQSKNCRSSNHWQLLVSLRSSEVHKLSNGKRGFDTPKGMQHPALSLPRDLKSSSTRSKFSSTVSYTLRGGLVYKFLTM